MFFVPTLTLARTKDRGGNQPAPIVIPRVVGEGEQSTNDKIHSYVWAVSYPLSTRRGKGSREDPTQLFFPFPTPRKGEEEERVGTFVLIVSQKRL